MSDVHASNLRMIGFSLPALGLNMLVTAVFVFLPALYAEHRGLGAATVGLIFLLAKFVDMIAAPIWGLFMDSYRTRYGRRRPWLALSVPILVLAISMLYRPPESATGFYLFIWLSTLYIGWDAWTISHTSWAMELSRDYDRRSRITGLLQVGVMVGGILISLVPALMERMGSPTYEETASAIGWFMIVVLPLTAIICLLSVPERATPNRPHLGFKKGAAIVLRNLALLRLLVANSLLTFSTYFVQGLFVFFVSYTLHLEERIGFILVFLVIGGLIGLPVWVKLSQNLSKHGAMQIAVTAGAIAPMLLLVLPPGSVVLTTAAFLIVGLNTSANEFLPRAMMADVCDQDHLQSGSERMGLYYSLLQLSSKFASGIGIFIGFSFLSPFGFDPALGSDNAEDALQRLRYLIVALPVVAYAIVIGLMWRYPISRERQRKMRDIIEERERMALRSSTD
ncbi:MAG: MFS transporter [Gammaproteobacteria bacterium]|nr:MFS transporter [Gammaproteobacteria bacterium]MDH3434025.1 MFS transporter [Gammaproteobacteria bacterium]